MTALEVDEGIFNNEDSKNKCFVIIREIDCDNNNEELVNKLKKAGFYNKNKADDNELDTLKNKIKETLPETNIKEYKVK